MRDIHTSIPIAASPATVWRILTDFGRYADWNPFITHVDGEVREGARLEVHLEPPGGRAMTFRPTVQRVEPERAFAWLGHLWVPRVFDGAHTFEIEPLEGDRVRFVHRESFGGLLVPMLWGQLEAPTRAGFEQMNAALKARAEAD